MASLIRSPFGQPILMRKAYGDALVELGHARKDVVVLSADVSSSDFSSMFEERFPDRFFNVGIAEPALVDAAVGLANGGVVAPKFGDPNDAVAAQILAKTFPEREVVQVGRRRQCHHFFCTAAPRRPPLACHFHFLRHNTEPYPPGG